MDKTGSAFTPTVPHLNMLPSTLCYLYLLPVASVSLSLLIQLTLNPHTWDKLHRFPSCSLQMLWHLATWKTASWNKISLISLYLGRNSRLSHISKKQREPLPEKYCTTSLPCSSAWLWNSILIEIRLASSLLASRKISSCKYFFNWIHAGCHLLFILLPLYISGILSWLNCPFRLGFH